MSNIEWCQKTWNPVVGCTRASRGCDHCYAVTMTHRLEAMGTPKYAGLTMLNGRGDRHFNGTVRTVEDALTIPLNRKKPTMWFVNSMSDLFHADVPFEFVDRVFAVMALCPQHTFQILTKRPERMAEYLAGSEVTSYERWAFWIKAMREWIGKGKKYAGQGRTAWMRDGDCAHSAVLPNVWIGASAEDQEQADARIPHLLRCPAAVRFLSCEPLLGPVDLEYALNIEPNETTGGWMPAINGAGTEIDWVIVGGESGAKARPCDVAWIRSIVGQCRDAGVPCFVKQMGANIVDRNDAGFDADEHLEERDDGTWGAANPRAWSSRVFVEHDIDNDATQYQGKPVRVRLNDRKGGDPSEWPEDLRVREMPEAAAI